MSRQVPNLSGCPCFQPLSPALLNRFILILGSGIWIIHQWHLPMSSLSCAFISSCRTDQHSCQLANLGFALFVYDLAPVLFSLWVTSSIFLRCPGLSSSKKKKCLDCHLQRKKNATGDEKHTFDDLQECHPGMVNLIDIKQGKVNE